jgi:hypothetical protein
MVMTSATLSFFGGKKDELLGCGGFEAVGVEVVSGAKLADGFREAFDGFAAEVGGAGELGTVSGGEGRVFAFEPGEEDAGGGRFEEEHLCAEAAGAAGGGGLSDGFKAASVGQTGKDGGGEDAGGESRAAEGFDGSEAEAGGGGAGFKGAGEAEVEGGDAEVEVE